MLILNLFQVLVAFLLLIVQSKNIFQGSCANFWYWQNCALSFSNWKSKKPFWLGYSSGKVVSTRTKSCQPNGLAVTAERINFLRYMSHLHSVHRGSFLEEVRSSEPRKLLPEAWGKELMRFNWPQRIHMSGSYPWRCSLWFAKSPHGKLQNCNRDQRSTSPKNPLVVGIIGNAATCSTQCLLFQLWILDRLPRCHSHRSHSVAQSKGDWICP